MGCVLIGHAAWLEGRLLASLALSVRAVEVSQGWGRQS